MPSETALAAASLIYSGILDRCPNLKICFSHGGGSLPYVLPRIDQAWEVWPHSRTTEHPPSYYAKKLYFDTIVYDPLNLQFMLKKFGAERMIVGSDYPFVLREMPAGKVIDDLEGISAEERRLMLGGNVLDFLQLEESSFRKTVVK